MSGFNISNHRVSAGETLWGIAQKNGTTVQDIAKLNPEVFQGPGRDAGGNRIYPGDNILLAVKNGPAQEPTLSDLKARAELAMSMIAGGVGAALVMAEKGPIGVTAGAVVGTGATLAALSHLTEK